MKQKLIYIGTSHIAIQKIIESELFDLIAAICETKRVTGDYKNIINENGIKLFLFSDKAEFEKIILQINCDECIYLIYQLDLIVPVNLVTKFSFYNLHAGSLETNRGAHPIIWSILNGDKKTELTLHKIDEKIDQGIIIGKYPVEVSAEDDSAVIKSNLEKGLPFLFLQLLAFLKGELKGVSVSGGVYRKPVQEKDYTIDHLNDNEEVIRNKIRSQKLYKGAVLNFENSKYFITKIIEWSDINNSCNQIQIEKGSIKIVRTNASFSLETIQS